MLGCIQGWSFFLIVWEKGFDAGARASRRFRNNGEMVNEMSA